MTDFVTAWDMRFFDQAIRSVGCAVGQALSAYAHRATAAGIKGSNGRPEHARGVTCWRRLAVRFPDQVVAWAGFFPTAKKSGGA